MHALGIIIQIALFTCFSQGTPTTAEQRGPALELTSRIDEVVVNASGAILRRIVETELPEGLTTLRIVVMERGLKDFDEAFKDTFTVLADGAEILQHSIQETTVPPDASQLRSLRMAYQQLSEKSAAAEERMLGGTSDIELLESVARTIAETRVELDSEDLLELIESINARRRTIAEDLARQKRVLTESLLQRERLERRIQETEQGTARVLCALVVKSPGGDARFTIERMDRQSTWTSEVEVDWNSVESSARVRLLGKVENRSGLDWNAVRLSLDTSGRENERFLKPLKENVIEILEEEEEEEEEQLEPVQTPPQPSAKTANSKSRDRVFLAKIPITLRRGETGLALLEDFETPFMTSLIARPMVAEEVHLVGSLRNTREAIIPKGTLRVIKDGRQFVRTEIPMINEKTDFQIPLGIQSGLVISRRLAAREEIRTGLLNGGKLTTLNYKIKIKNLDDRACQIRIEDRIPISENEDIEILLKSSSPEPVVPPDFEGTLQWLLEIPAGGGESSPVTIDWEVTVAHSADLETTEIID